LKPPKEDKLEMSGDELKIGLQGSILDSKEGMSPKGTKSAPPTKFDSDAAKHVDLDVSISKTDYKNLI
jgi:hypothetical protein